MIRQKVFIGDWWEIRAEQISRKLRSKKIVGLLHLLLRLGEVPLVVPRCHDPRTRGHLHEAEAEVHRLEVEVHLLEDDVLGPVPVLLDSHGVGDGLHVM